MTWQHLNSLGVALQLRDRQPKGYYLVCDHLCAAHAMQNDQLYMTKQEHLDALEQASFKAIKMPLEIEGLCLFEMSLE